MLDQPGVLNFTTDYLLELAARFIDWTVVGWVVVLAAVYRLASPWLRMTTLTLAGLAWLGSANLLALQAVPQVADAQPVQGAGAVTSIAEPDTATLNT
ncbi:hypothetical protein D3C81_2057830 [compost metagenome]